MERLGIVLALICGACGPPRIANVGDGGAGETTGTGGADEWGESATTGSHPTTSTGADEASTGASGAEGPKFDLPQLDVDGGGLPPHGDCLDPFDGTDVTGPGPLGDFNGKWGYFGGYGGNFDWFHIVLFDETADLQAEIEFGWESYGFIDQGPALVVFPSLSVDDIPFVGPADAEHIAFDDGEYLMLTVSVESLEQIDVPDASWLMTGNIAPWPDEDNAEYPLSGPFKAVYCAAFDQNIIAE